MRLMVWIHDSVWNGMHHSQFSLGASLLLSICFLSLIALCFNMMHTLISVVNVGFQRLFLSSRSLLLSLVFLFWPIAFSPWYPLLVTVLQNVYAARALASVALNRFVYYACKHVGNLQWTMRLVPRQRRAAFSLASPTVLKLQQQSW